MDALGHPDDGILDCGIRGPPETLQGDVLPFFYTGLAPVAALWGSTWVWFGYRKYRR